MSLKSDCYALVQQIVTKRDKLCKGPGCMNISASGHHIFRRNCMGTAFDTAYVIGLCGECHPWAQQNPDDFQQWAIYLLGEEQFRLGQMLANSIVKYLDFDEIKKNLKKELDGL